MSQHDDLENTYFLTHIVLVGRLVKVVGNPQIAAKRFCLRVISTGLTDNVYKQDSVEKSKQYCSVPAS